MLLRAMRGFRLPLLMAMRGRLTTRLRKAVREALRVQSQQGDRE